VRRSIHIACRRDGDREIKLYFHIGAYSQLTYAKTEKTLYFYRIIFQIPHLPGTAIAETLVNEEVFLQ
jgi:hypothetical protein